MLTAISNEDIFILKVPVGTSARQSRSEHPVPQSVYQPECHIHFIAACCLSEVRDKNTGVIRIQLYVGMYVTTSQRLSSLII
jgi:hypothetical protein